MRKLDVGVASGIVAAAFGTVGVTMAVFGDMRVSFSWSVGAAAVFIAIGLLGAMLSPERSIATAAFLLFGSVSVIAAMFGDLSRWIGDLVAVMNGDPIEYVWQGQTFRPSLTDVLFGSASIVGFVAATTLFLLGGLAALAQATRQATVHRPSAAS